MALSLWMLQNTLAAGCLALLVAVACRFGRFSPALRHALWLVVLLNLVVPPIVELPLPRWLGIAPPAAPHEPESGGRKLVLIAAERFYDFTEIDPDAETGASGTLPNEAFAPSLPSPNSAERVPDNRAERSRTMDSIPHATQSDTGTDTTFASQWRARWQWQRFLLWSWCTGTGVFVLIQGRRLVHLHQMKRRGHADAGPLTVVVGRLARELRVTPPPIWIVPGLPSPALCAWGRTSLLWPEGAASQFTSAGEQAVVLHELAHLRRRDHWVGWLELLAGCVWWWNPLFWYARHQLHENAELACDSWVVAVLPEKRRAYAEALIDVAQGPPPAPLAGIVLGANDGSRKLMERRLIMIMRGKVRYQVPAIGLAVIALIAVATIPRWTIGQDGTTSESDRGIDGQASSLGTEELIPRSSMSSANAAAVSGEGDLFRDESVPRSELSANDQEFTSSPKPVTALQAAEEKAAPRLSDDAEGDAAFTPPAAPHFPPPTQLPAVGDDDPFGPPAREEQLRTPEENRIRNLEAQLAAIQKELGTLKKGNPSLPGNPPPRPDAPRKSPLKLAGEFRSSEHSKPDASDESVETIVITRSTYKLPPGRAVLLEKALRELLNDDVEIKVKNDSLQITAAEEDQQAIHQLIRLMQRKGREPAKVPMGEFTRPRDVPVESYRDTVNDFDGRERTRSQPVTPTRGVPRGDDER